MTTSLKVAQVFGKDHNLVMRAIRDLDCSTNFAECNFALCSYCSAEATRTYPMYQITKDGFAFLTLGFTGARAAEFKERYIAEFNRMEKTLRERHAPKPMSHMEMMELQFQIVKEINLKAELAQQKAVEATCRVEAIEHKIATNGCSPGYLPVKLAHQRYGKALSRTMFELVMDWWGIEKQSYSYTVPETGALQWAMSVEEAELQKMVRDFCAGCHQVTERYYTHPDFGNSKRFHLNKAR